MKLIKRRLRSGYLYRITAINADTMPEEVLGRLCRVIAQMPDKHTEGKTLCASVIMEEGPFTGSQMYIQGQFKLHNPSPQTTCYCRAYAWPHRLGSGKCWGLMTGPFCSACGRPTTPTSMAGQIVSQCCASEMYVDSQLEEPM